MTPTFTRRTSSLSKSWIWTLALWTVFQLLLTHGWTLDDSTVTLMGQITYLFLLAFVISAFVTIALTFDALLARVPSPSWLGRWRDRPRHPPQPLYMQKPAPTKWVIASIVLLILAQVFVAMWPLHEF